MKFDGKDLTVEELTENSFDDVDIAFFSAGGSQSKKYGPIAGKAGHFTHTTIGDLCSTVLWSVSFLTA